MTGIPTSFLAVQLYVSEWLSFTFSKLRADLDSSIVVWTAFSPFLLQLNTGIGLPCAKHCTVNESPSFSVITSVLGIRMIDGGTLRQIISKKKTHKNNYKNVRRSFEIKTAYLTHLDCSLDFRL